MTVYVRETWSGALRWFDGSAPYAITFPYTKQLSIKSICGALKAGGYGTRAFGPANPEAAALEEGMTKEQKAEYRKRRSEGLPWREAVP